MAMAGLFRAVGQFSQFVAGALLLQHISQHLGHKHWRAALKAGPPIRPSLMQKPKRKEPVVDSKAKPQEPEQVKPVVNSRAKPQELKQAHLSRHCTCR